MWLLVFAAIAQGALVGERVLNRILKVFVPCTRSPTKALADKMVIGSFFSHFFSSLFVILGIVAQAHVLLVQNAAIVAVMVMVTGILALMSDSSGIIYVAVYNTYNSGVGFILSTGFTVPLKLVDGIFGGLLPIYNLAAYATKNFLTKILIQLVQLNVEQLPALVQNIGFFFSACAVSVVTFGTSVIDCMGLSGLERLMLSAVHGEVVVSVRCVRCIALRVLDCQAFASADRLGVCRRRAQTNPYVPENLQCFANTNYIQLDLMTPGLYMRGALRAALAIAISSCPAAGSVLEIVLYPILDYNFYKALHSAGNAAVHLVVGLPIITYHWYVSLPLLCLR